MLAGLCLLSSLGIVVFSGRLVWLWGYRRGLDDAWQDYEDNKAFLCS